LKQKINLKSIIGKVILVILLIIIVVWSIFPLFWMFLTSFKQPEEIYQMPPSFNFKPTLDNYYQMIVKRDVLHNFYNSILMAGSSTLIALVLGSMAGFALARGRIPGKGNIAFWIISTRMAPIAVVLLPLFIIFQSLHLLYTPSSLIISYVSFNLPFAIWLLWGFFESVPLEIEEAAVCDGCSKFRVFWKISIPLITPGLVTTGILCFMFAWNDFMFASVFTNKNTLTLPIVASRFMSGHAAVPWGQVTATASFVFLPILVGGILIRRYLVEGLTLGAIK
jgi:multiple sugar transport system permease protein